jgi:hypothetical protein
MSELPGEVSLDKLHVGQIERCLDIRVQVSHHRHHLIDNAHKRSKISRYNIVYEVPPDVSASS